MKRRLGSRQVRLVAASKRTPTSRPLSSAVVQRSIVAGVVSALCYALVVTASAEGKTLLPNACSLLTDAQAAAALGGRVASRLHPTSSGEDACVWAGPANAGSRPTLSLLVLRVRKSDFVDSALANGGVAVSGVGETAFRFPRYPGVLWARKKDDAIEVQSSSGRPLRLLTRIALPALERL